MYLSTKHNQLIKPNILDNIDINRKHLSVAMDIIGYHCDVTMSSSFLAGSFTNTFERTPSTVSILDRFLMRMPNYFAG